MKTLNIKLASSIGLICSTASSDQTTGLAIPTGLAIRVDDYNDVASIIDAASMIGYDVTHFAVPLMEPTQFTDRRSIVALQSSVRNVERPFIVIDLAALLTDLDDLGGPNVDSFEEALERTRALIKLISLTSYARPITYCLVGQESTCTPMTEQIEVFCSAFGWDRNAIKTSL